MGACATKPMVSTDEAAIPAPEPVDDMVKSTKKVTVVKEERKEGTENVVIVEEKPQSLASLLDEKQAFLVVKVSSMTKAKEKPMEEPPKEAATVTVAELWKEPATVTVAELLKEPAMVTVAELLKEPATVTVTVAELLNEAAPGSGLVKK